MPAKPKRPVVVDLGATWRQTQRRLQQQLPIPAPSIAVVHDFDPSYDEPPDGPLCQIALSGDDSLVAGARVSAAVGVRPAVLCFASKNMPGGAVASGVNAQEECIFRRSSISLALPPEKPPRCYPLPPGRCVLVSHVAVVRTPNHDWLETPFVEVDVISSAAVSKPALHGRDTQTQMTWLAG